MVTATPQRIQLSRKKGWRKPEGCIVVARPSLWGNPYRVTKPSGPGGGPLEAVTLYHLHLLTHPEDFPSLDELRGHDLACWCPLTDERGGRVPCHADVLLELANRGGGIRRFMRYYEDEYE